MEKQNKTLRQLQTEHNFFECFKELSITGDLRNESKRREMQYQRM